MDGGNWRATGERKERRAVEEGFKMAGRMPLGWQRGRASRGKRGRDDWVERKRVERKEKRGEKKGEEKRNEV